MEEAVFDLRTMQETLLLFIAPIWFRRSQNIPINVYWFLLHRGLDPKVTVYHSPRLKCVEKYVHFPVRFHDVLLNSERGKLLKIIWNKRVIIIKADISPSYEGWLYSPASPSSPCCDPWKMGILTSHINEAPLKTWHELCLSYSLSLSSSNIENR